MKRGRLIFEPLLFSPHASGESMMFRATMRNIEREITHARGVIKADSTRTSSMQKIVRLIEHDNPTLDTETKLAISEEIYVMSMGLMQIMPDTGYFLRQHEGLPWTDARDVLFNPIYNIRLGCRYLSSLIDVYQIDGGWRPTTAGNVRPRAGCKAAATTRCWLPKRATMCRRSLNFMTCIEIEA